MRKLIVVLSYLLLAGKAQAQKSVNRPKMVVGVVIDQMRWDYLYRYYDLLSDGGFKRLMREGFNCQNTMINYIPSFTAPGHTCIYTGSVPAIHGIVGNDFVDNFTCNAQYCVTDYNVHLTNSVDSLSGSMSPKNVLTTTITDELRLATNFNSRVYGVAIKDRGSIIPAGHLANAAYWFDENTGNFVSSSYYTNTSPSWLATFNRRRTSDSLLNIGWKLMLPASKYTQSSADANRYEGPFKGESSPVFPHMFTSLSGKDKYHALLSTPGGNTMTSQMAFACMDGEQLGHRGNTDFLCISMSSTDYVGHQFGPNSMEAEDVYLRLDQEIANLLNGLDARYGKGNYLLFLTADHGAAHNPQYLKDQKVPAGFVSASVKNDLNKKLKKQFGEDSLVTHFINYQVYLNEKPIADNDLDRKKIKKAITEFFYAMPEIEFVVDLENINQTALPEPLHTMVVNGYYRGRSGDIEVIPNPGWFSGYGATGTTHGTWHPYDTHIPLLWYGWNVKAGETYATVNMTDISATLAAMLHIQMPNGCVGKPITELVGKNK